MLAEAIARVRRNHALEHATVALLLDRGIRPPLGGYSTQGGFFIFGRASTEELSEAAHEALDRLRAGARELAISPYCGTNLVTGAVLAGLVSTLIMGRRKERRLRRLPVVAMGVVGATMLGRPLGMAIQRRLTTLAEMDGLGITGIRPLWSGRYTVHRVSTG